MAQARKDTSSWCVWVSQDGEVKYANWYGGGRSAWTYELFPAWMNKRNATKLARTIQESEDLNARISQQGGAHR